MQDLQGDISELSSMSSYHSSLKCSPLVQLDDGTFPILALTMMKWIIFHLKYYAIQVWRLNKLTSLNEIASRASFWKGWTFLVARALLWPGRADIIWAGYMPVLISQLRGCKWVLIDAIEMKTQTRCSNNRQSRVLGMETIFSTSNSLPYSSHTPSYGSFIVFSTNKEDEIWNNRLWTERKKNILFIRHWG